MLEPGVAKLPPHSTQLPSASAPTPEDSRVGVTGAEDAAGLGEGLAAVGVEVGVTKEEELVLGDVREEEEVLVLGEVREEEEVFLGEGREVVEGDFSGVAATEGEVAGGREEDEGDAGTEICTAGLGLGAFFLQLAQVWSSRRERGREHCTHIHFLHTLAAFSELDNTSSQRAHTQSTQYLWSLCLMYPFDCTKALSQDVHKQSLQ